MAEHFILCALSPVEPSRARQADYYYHGGSPDRKYPGYQTNEAPVECLIDLGLSDGFPVTGVICLTSQKCLEEVADAEGRSFSAKQHFEESIVAFYRDSLGYPDETNPALRKGTDGEDGFFITVDYDGNNPAANLEGIVRILDRADALVDIDTTGGPRDVAFLLTTVVQFLEAKYRAQGGDGGGQPLGLGTVVYTNFARHAIYRQNATFDLDRLIHAISSFTEFGKAEPLVRFFEPPAGEGGRSAEAYELCSALQAFADDLSLCKTGRVNENLNRVHGAIDELERVTGEKMARYSELQGRIARCESADEREALEGELDAATIPRSQILFMTLSGSLREGIPTPIGDDATDPERARQTLEIIRWCARRGLLQQALALFKERVPECLSQLGLLGWGDEPLTGESVDDRNDDMVDRLTQIGTFANARKGRGSIWHPEVLRRDLVNDTAYMLNRNRVWARLRTNVWSDYRTKMRLLRRTLCMAHPAAFANGRALAVHDEEHLRAALAWYGLINTTRNTVMHVHAEESDGDFVEDYLRLCEAFFTDATQVSPKYREGRDTPESLRDDLLQAVDAVEGKCSLILKPLAHKMIEDAMRSLGYGLLPLAAANEVMALEIPTPIKLGDTTVTIKSRLGTSGEPYLFIGEGNGWAGLTKQIQDDEGLAIMRVMRVLGTQRKEADLGEFMTEESPDDAQDFSVRVRDEILRETAPGDVLTPVALGDAKRLYDLVTFTTKEEMTRVFGTMRPRSANTVMQMLTRLFPENFEAMRIVYGTNA